MAKCKNCKNNKSITQNGEKYPWCFVYDDCYDVEVDRDCKSYETMTNADRIRSMTDEELAEFLVGFKNTFGTEYEGEMSCLDWLKEEGD